MYGELKCFIKLFTRLKLLQTFRTVIRKFCKNLVFTSLDRSNRNRIPIEIGRDSMIISFTPSIDWTKNFDQSNILNFEFHLENSRIWIFTLFILQMNTLQPYIIITIYPYIYLYIQHIYPWNSALGSNKRDEPHTWVTPWGLPLMWDCESP